MIFRWDDSADGPARERPFRLALVGGESTGKTTLAGALAGSLGWPLVPEAARTYVERVARVLTRFDVAPIASLHVKMLREAERASPEGIVLDTDLVATVAYARHYYGMRPSWLLAVARRRLADLYVLCPPDQPFEAEPLQRGSEADRQETHRLMADLLEDLGARVVTVRGTRQERVGQVRTALDRLQTPDPD